MTTLALSVVAALVIAVLAWKDRSWAAAAILFALPTYLVRFSIGGIPFTMLEAMILALFGVFLIKDWRKLRTTHWRWWHGLVFGLFFLAGIFGLLVTPDLRGGLGIFKAYMVEPVLFCLVVWVGVDQTKQLHRLFVALVASAAITGLLAGLQYYLGWGIPEPWNLWDGQRRATVGYGYPNAVGLALAPVLAATIGAFVATKKYRAWLGAAAIAMAIGLLAAKVEGAIIAVAAAALVTLFFTRAKWWAVGVGIVGLGTALLVEPLRSLIFFQSTSGDVRLALWKGTWNLLQANPVFGAGLAGFPMTYDTYRLPSHVELLLYPHNLFLDFWVELGLIGLIWIVFTVGIIFTASIRAIQHPQQRVYGLVIFAASLATVVYGLVDVPYFKNDLSVMFWTLLAAVLVLQKKKKRSTL